MATITAPPLCLAPRRRPPPRESTSLVGSSSPSPAPAKTPRADGGTTPRSHPPARGRRCRPPMFAASGVRARLRVRPPAAPGAVGGLGAADAAERRGAWRRWIEKVYTLLDLHELAPRTATRCASATSRRRRVPVPVLVSCRRSRCRCRASGWCASRSRTSTRSRIDTKSAELCTTIRAAVRARTPAPPAPRPRSPISPSLGRPSRSRAPPPPPVSIDRERNRVLVARRSPPPPPPTRARSAARAPSSRRPALLACSSMLARDPLCLALHDVLAAATQRLDATIADVKGRSAALLDKRTLLPAARSRPELRPQRLRRRRGPRAGSAQASHLLRHAALRLARRRRLRVVARRAIQRDGSQHAAGPSSAGSSHGVPRDGARRAPQAPGARTPRVGRRRRRRRRLARRDVASAAAVAARAAREVMPIERRPADSAGPSEDGARSDAHARAAAWRCPASRCACSARSARWRHAAAPAAVSRARPSAGAAARAPRPRTAPRRRWRWRSSPPSAAPTASSATQRRRSASARCRRRRRRRRGGAGLPRDVALPAAPLARAPAAAPRRFDRLHLLVLPPSVLFHDSLPLNQLVVDKNTTVRGHHTTISSALRVAQPGDRLLIRPGVYRESLRIDVPVMIVGCPGGGGGNGGGGGGGVTITSSRNHTVQSTAPFARLEALRQTGSSRRRACSRRADGSR